MPVLAASKVPTNNIEIPRPLLYLLNKLDIEVNNSSATLDFYKITPINTNNGTATSVAFVIIPKSLFGIVSSRFISKTPKILATKAKRMETPPKVKATGNPKRRLKQITKNNNNGRNSIIIKVRKNVCKTLHEKQNGRN